MSPAEDKENIEKLLKIESAKKALDALQQTSKSVVKIFGDAYEKIKEGNVEVLSKLTENYKKSANNIQASLESVRKTLGKLIETGKVQDESIRDSLSGLVGLVDLLQKHISKLGETLRKQKVDIEEIESPLANIMNRIGLIREKLDELGLASKSTWTTFELGKYTVYKLAEA